jgi:site-specific recombinase XerD
MTVMTNPGDTVILPTTMLGPLVVPGGTSRAGEIEDLSRRAAIYATRARGEGTQRAYRAAWTGFCQWCQILGREPLTGDPDTIAMYLVRRADDGCAVSTLRVGLAAIRTAHLLAGVPLDLRHAALSMVLEGITRSKGVRPRRQATPAVPELLRRLLAVRPAAETPLGARDRAMLLLGFAAALRRSELVALTLADVIAVPGRGVQLTISRSKTDQQGRGDLVAVAANRSGATFCPAVALNAWLTHRRGARDFTGGASDGERPLFCAVTKGGNVTGTALSDKAVVRLVKQAATAAGLDSARFSGHSLRAGLATAAGDAGAGLAELMRQTRHRSTEVALGYLRPADLWRNNVTAKVFAAVSDPEEV